MSNRDIDASTRFQFALTPEDSERHPAYSALGHRLSESATACDLLDRVALEQRNPILIFAILHFLALTGNEQLASLYASLDADSPSSDDFAAGVVAVLEASPELVAAQLHRTTQTNEIGRSAVLRAVLTRLRDHGQSTVDLIDIGASAGLNLYLDHYPVRSVGPVEGLTLLCENVGDSVPTDPLPRIENRLGIDLHPLSLDNPDDAFWLRACLWPEDRGRLRRLNLVESLHSSWEPVTVLEGSAVDRLDDALSLCRAKSVVIWHTWAVAYFPLEDQRQLATALRSLVESGRATWVSMEWPRMVPGLDLPTPTTESPVRGMCQIAVAERGGQLEHWGWCHHHGRWISLPSDGPKA